MTGVLKKIYVEIYLLNESLPNFLKIIYQFFEKFFFSISYNNFFYDLFYFLKKKINIKKYITLNYLKKIKKINLTSNIIRRGNLIFNFFLIFRLYLFVIIMQPFFKLPAKKYGKNVNNYFKLMALVLTCYMITIKMQKISLVFMKNIRQVYIVTSEQFILIPHIFLSFFTQENQKLKILIKHFKKIELIFQSPLRVI